MSDIYSGKGIAVIAGVIVTVVLLITPVTGWAYDRLGQLGARVSVLEANYQHICETLVRIERKIDEGGK